MASDNPLLSHGEYVKIVTGPGWVDRDGVPREHDDFGSIRVARAALAWPPALQCLKA